MSGKVSADLGPGARRYSKVLDRVSRGEEVEAKRRGKVVAKVVPPDAARPRRVDWTTSAALNRAAWSTTLTAEESAAIPAESQGS